MEERVTRQLEREGVIGDNERYREKDHLSSKVFLTTNTKEQNEGFPSSTIDIPGGTPFDSYLKKCGGTWAFEVFAGA